MLRIATTFKSERKKGLWLLIFEENIHACSYTSVNFRRPSRDSTKVLICRRPRLYMYQWFWNTHIFINYMFLYVIDENKINTALHICSRETLLGQPFGKSRIFFYHFPEGREWLLWFCKFNMIFELQGANKQSSVNNIPLEGYENKIGMQGSWLFLRGLLGKGLIVIVTFLFQYQYSVCL